MFKRTLCVAAFVGLAVAGHAAGHSEAVQTTIQSQLNAFEAGEFDRAFEFASPTIQRMFQSPEMFENMVRQGYPMVVNNSRVDFLELREISGRVWQKVLIQGTDGSAFVLDYQMIETPDGWQINGVQILPSVGVGV